MNGSEELTLLSYPRDLIWPEEASVLAALHPEIIQAPFRDPTFYVMTGLDPSDESRYRSWARPVRKPATVVGLALTAALHACLGRGDLQLMIPAPGLPAADQIKVVPRESTVPTGVVEVALMDFLRSGGSASLPSALSAVANPAWSAKKWLGQLGRPSREGTKESLVQACSLAGSLAFVYMSAADYFLSPSDPNTTLEGILIVIDEAILDASKKL